MGLRKLLSNLYTIMHVILFLIFLSISYIIYQAIMKCGSEEKETFNSVWSNRNCVSDKLKNVILIVNYNHPFYHSLPILKSYYEIGFGNVIFCGPKGNTSRFDVLTQETFKGFYGYICLANVIQKYPNYEGYLFTNDDLIINLWTLHSFNFDKIWESPPIPRTIGKYSAPRNWYWWNSTLGIKQCSLALQELSLDNNHAVYIKQLERAGSGMLRCYRGRSDIVYVPKKYSLKFHQFSQVFEKHRVFLEIAFPTTLRMLEDEFKFEKLYGVYLPGRVGDPLVTRPELFWKNYNPDINFIHPLKFSYPGRFEFSYTLFDYHIKRKALSYPKC